jgi:hypothetical protein
VNEIPEIITWRISMQVGVITWLSGKYCRNDSCVATICSIYRPCHVKITLHKWCSASGSYSSMVQVLSSLPFWYTCLGEAQFTRDGTQIFHIQHLWTQENPHVILASHHQQSFSINTWAGIYGDNLFGPHVVPSKLTRQNYRAWYLERNVPDVLADMLLIIYQELLFMHDGSPAHFSLIAHWYLKQKFPVGGQLEVVQLPGLHIQLI